MSKCSHSQDKWYKIVYYALFRYDYRVRVFNFSNIKSWKLKCWMSNMSRFSHSLDNWWTEINCSTSHQSVRSKIHKAGMLCLRKRTTLRFDIASLVYGLCANLCFMIHRILKFHAYQLRMRINKNQTTSKYELYYGNIES